MEFKKLEKTLMINGNKVKAQVTITVEEDDIDPAGDFDFGNEKENAEYLARFRSGELFVAVITVRATALGQEGTDCLGGCHIHSNNMFNSKPFDSDVESMIKDQCMIERATEELAKHIVDAANLLAPYRSKRTKRSA